MKRIVFLILCIMSFAFSAYMWMGAILFLVDSVWKIAPTTFCFVIVIATIFSIITVVLFRKYKKLKNDNK